MLLAFLIYFILALIVALYFFLTWHNNYFEKHKVPHERPTFFFGNYKETVEEKKHAGVVLKEYYDKFKDAAYFGFYKFNAATITLRDPELIKSVLIKDFASFANNNVQALAENDPLFHYNAFAQMDEAWKTTRSYMSPCLTSNKIKTMYTHMEQKSKNLVNYLNKVSQGKRTDDIDAKDLSATYTTDVIATSVFGVDSNSFEDPNSMYRQITKSIVFPSFWSGIKIVAITIFPFLQRFIKFRITKLETEEIIKKITKDTIEYRLKNSIVRNDFYQQMITMREKIGAKVFSDEYIACQAFGFLADGFETSSTAMAYILFELGKNVDIQNKLREDMKEIYERNNKTLPFDELHNAKFLEMVISEALRIHPPVLMLEKVCSKSYEFPPATPESKPLKVQPGAIIAIPVYALQLDPKYFPNPDKFNPDNFSVEAMASRHKCTYLPFGDGPRACYGFRLAMTQIKSAIANIVLNFEVRTASKCLHTGYTINPSTLLKEAKGGLWVNFQAV